MDISDLTIGLALAAGLASFLSPCVLALVPVYVSYLSGRAAGGEGGANNRLITFLHGVAFVVGFSIVFIVFQIISYGLGRALFEFQFWLGRIGGLIILIFGLHMIGVFRIPFLEYDIRVHKQLPDQQRLGYVSSALMGVFFSAGWSPCIGPVLTLIVALSAQSGSLWTATGLGVAYSAGLAIPFLVAALGIGWVTILLRRYSKIMRYTEVAMGIVMVIAGIMMMFGIFNLLATMFPGWTPEI